MSHLEVLFPGLLVTQYRIVKAADVGYNCIGWAACDANRNWWPFGGLGIYWPPDVPREETVSAFTAMFGTLGYAAGADDSLESGAEKVALFASALDVPTHAARQLASGLWTSKIGELEVIEHELRALEGDAYGTVASVLKRPRVSEEP